MELFTDQEAREDRQERTMKDYRNVLCPIFPGLSADAGMWMRRPVRSAMRKQYLPLLISRAA